MTEMKQGYKNTEVGIIPEDWEVILLESLATKIGSGITPTGGSNVYKEDGRPLVRSQNIGWGKLLLDDVAYIDDEIHQTFPNTEIQLNDVFLNISGASIGRSSFANDKLVGGNVNQHVCIIRVIDNKLNPIFLNLFLLSKKGQKQIDSFQSGGNRQGLNIGQIRTFQIPIPPTLTEQTAIATALSDADALISGLEKLIAKKRNIKQGAMQKLLQPKEGWEVKKLGDIATIVRGASPRPIEDPKWFDENSPIGWVRISDVTKSVKILIETTQKLSEIGIQSSRYVEEGNLIMSICATVGRPILTKINVCIHDGFVVFRNPQVNVNYIYYFLSFIEKNWSKNGQTGSQMNLNTTLINTTEIPIPKSKAEQTRIATILSDMDNEITALETKLEKYKKVKLGMMQNLLTGKVRLV